MKTACRMILVGWLCCMATVIPLSSARGDDFVKIIDDGARTIAEFMAMSSQPETVVYKTVGDERLSLLVMKPEGVQPGEKSPVMVWIHGGGWTGGNPHMFVPHMRYAVARGAVAISVQYRLVKLKNNQLAKGVSLEDCVADCADAIRYLRIHADDFGIDPQKVIVLGDSAGGHLALCLGVLPLGKDTRVNAVIDFNGISDLVDSKWIGVIRPGDNLSASAAQYSPLRHVAEEAQAGLPPIQIQHGEEDTVVLPQEAKDFYQVCTDNGVDSEIVLWPKTKHAFVVTGYIATDEQITNAILSADAFLLKRGLLSGPPSLRMPKQLKESSQ